jgi:hypothetical protein
MMIYAHQGGWDEFLLVIGPLLIIAWLVTVAKKRADRSSRDDQSETSTD